MKQRHATSPSTTAGTLKIGSRVFSTWVHSAPMRLRKPDRPPRALRQAGSARMKKGRAKALPCEVADPGCPGPAVVSSRFPAPDSGGTDRAARCAPVTSPSRLREAHRRPLEGEDRRPMWTAVEPNGSTLARLSQSFLNINASLTKPGRRRARRRHAPCSPEPDRPKDPPPLSRTGSRRRRTRTGAGQRRHETLIDSRIVRLLEHCGAAAGRRRSAARSSRAPFAASWPTPSCSPSIRAPGIRSGLPARACVPPSVASSRAWRSPISGRGASRDPIRELLTTVATETVGVVAGASGRSCGGGSARARTAGASARPPGRRQHAAIWARWSRPRSRIGSVPKRSGSSTLGTTRYLGPLTGPYSVPRRAAGGAARCARAPWARGLRRRPSLRAMPPARTGRHRAPMRLEYALDGVALTHR